MHTQSSRGQVSRTPSRDLRSVCFESPLGDAYDSLDRGAQRRRRPVSYILGGSMPCVDLAAVQ
jgi:hypothetical protein